MKKICRQTGQTLIETLAAVFILVMGITAAAGLAIYANSTASGSAKQIIATGLARQGVEAVKNMRDTNWLKLIIDTNCYDYVSGTNIVNCYKDWLDHGGNWNNNSADRGFRMDPGSGAGGTTYILTLDPSSANRAWILTSESSKFGLNLDTNYSNSNFAGFYVPSNSVAGNSDYYRKITLIKDTTSPFRTNLERLKVISQVWWTDRKCPRVSDWPGLGKCSVEIQTYLTNWKNY